MGRLMGGGFTDLATLPDESSSGVEAFFEAANWQR